MQSPHAGSDQVLVVDDDDDIRGSLIEFLEDHGHHAVGAANGSEALALLNPPRPRPCLIILDLMMPVMDGSAFRSEQLQRPAVADIPVIVVSAYKDVEARAQQLGAVQWLAKPFDLRALLRLVEENCAFPG
jgi:two-component system, chemotaxis family, chemotaxis protein CheY